jgi:hypothetical protein
VSPPRHDDERILRLAVAGVAILTLGAVAVTEIIRTGALSPGVLALLAGPVALAITVALVGKSNGGPPR